jgi:hypothetical protein
VVAGLRLPGVAPDHLGDAGRRRAACGGTSWRRGGGRIAAPLRGGITGPGVAGEDGGMAVEAVLEQRSLRMTVRITSCRNPWVCGAGAHRRSSPRRHSCPATTPPAAASPPWPVHPVRSFPASPLIVPKRAPALDRGNRPSYTTRSTTEASLGGSKCVFETCGLQSAIGSKCVATRRARRHLFPNVTNLGRSSFIMSETTPSSVCDLPLPPPDLRMNSPAQVAVCNQPSDQNALQHGAPDGTFSRT